MMKNRMCIARMAGLIAIGFAIVGFAFTPFLVYAQPSHFDPERFAVLWPNTDFTQHSVPYEEIFSGGVPRDGIPPIDDPVTDTIEARCPVSATSRTNRPSQSRKAKTRIAAPPRSSGSWTRRSATSAGATT